MNVYRYAMWAPSPTWSTGYVYGAPVADFRAAFPGKVKLLGVPLMVWDVDLDHARENA